MAQEPTTYNLDAFLSSVEAKAFRMAQFATHSEADALDIVQDAMIKLCERYADKPDDWKPLFFKILENKILDWHRKQQIQRKLFFWRKNVEDDEEQSELPEREDDSDNPELGLIGEQTGEKLLNAIAELPIKQQQCFLLRSWEQFSIKETASAMGINENSVKTHYLRACQKLQEHLQ